MRAPRRTEQGERAPGAGGTGQHRPQFVGEAARPPQFALAQDAERGGYHSDTFVGMVVSACKPEPGRAAIAR